MTTNPEALSNETEEERYLPEELDEQELGQQVVQEQEEEGHYVYSNEHLEEHDARSHLIHQQQQLGHHGVHPMHSHHDHIPDHQEELSHDYHDASAKEVAPLMQQHQQYAQHHSLGQKQQIHHGKAYRVSHEHDGSETGDDIMEHHHHQHDEHHIDVHRIELDRLDEEDLGPSSMTCTSGRELTEESSINMAVQEKQQEKQQEPSYVSIQSVDSNLSSNGNGEQYPIGGEIGNRFIRDPYRDHNKTSQNRDNSESGATASHSQEKNVGLNSQLQKNSTPKSRVLSKNQIESQALPTPTLFSKGTNDPKARRELCELHKLVYQNHGRFLNSSRCVQCHMCKYCKWTPECTQPLFHVPSKLLTLSAKIDWKQEALNRALEVGQVSMEEYEQRQEELQTMHKRAPKNKKRGLASPSGPAAKAPIDLYAISSNQGRAVGARDGLDAGATNGDEIAKRRRLMQALENESRCQAMLKLFNIPDLRAPPSSVSSNPQTQSQAPKLTEKERLNLALSKMLGQILCVAASSLAGSNSEGQLLVDRFQNMLRPPCTPANCSAKARELAGREHFFGRAPCEPDNCPATKNLVKVASVAEHGAASIAKMILAKSGSNKQVLKLQIEKDELAPVAESSESSSSSAEAASSPKYLLTINTAKTSRKKFDDLVSGKLIVSRNIGPKGRVRYERPVPAERVEDVLNFIAARLPVKAQLQKRTHVIKGHTFEQVPVFQIPDCVGTLFAEFVKAFQDSESSANRAGFPLFKQIVWQVCA